MGGYSLFVMADNNGCDTWRRCAAALGGLGVCAGAFGAHALKKSLEQRGTADSWRTAVMYQLLHSLALLSVATREIDHKSTVRYNTAASLWTTGTVLSSGSIYALSLGAGERFKLLGPVTPV